MEKKLGSAVGEIVSSITGSEEFKECIRLKEKMDKSDEIKELVAKVKKLQKQLIKTADPEIREELEKVQERLDSIPLYDSYKKKLALVNQQIELIKDDLNDYFYRVVNPKE
ncbi:MAG: YlbF family regulator [Mycoplasmatota bacterium]|nr:YlbF family regulator [Mycoplasmatota bacterium]